MDHATYKKYTKCASRIASNKMRHASRDSVRCPICNRFIKRADCLKDHMKKMDPEFLKWRRNEENLQEHSEHPTDDAMMFTYVDFMHKDFSLQYLKALVKGFRNRHSTPMVDVIEVRDESHDVYQSQNLLDNSNLNNVSSVVDSAVENFSEPLVADVSNSATVDLGHNQEMASDNEPLQAEAEQIPLESDHHSSHSAAVDSGHNQHIDLGMSSDNESVVEPEAEQIRKVAPTRNRKSSPKQTQLVDCRTCISLREVLILVNNVRLE